LKFFLDASLQTRAKRRFKELSSTTPQSLEVVETDMRRRDTNDSTRDLAPLKPAKDAVRIDSTDLTIEDVVDRMVSAVNALT
jgi:cytidylate kinase